MYKVCPDCKSAIIEKAKICPVCGHVFPEKLSPGEKIQLPKRIALTKSICRGVGFWTSVCYAFANFFGTNCKRYRNKVNLIIADIKRDLLFQTKNYENYNFGEITIVSDRSLSFTGIITGFLREDK